MNLNLNLLNNKQYQAVNTKKQKVLVIAGAGSGKTRVITTRIAKLLSEGESPKDIAAFTFTNKAANEMKFRLKYLTNSETECMVQTFHSFAYSFICLDMFYTELGFNDKPNVIFESDKAKLIKSILEKYNTNYSNTNFITAISKIKNRGIVTEIHNCDLQLLNTIYHEYQQKLRQSNLIDFDDMIPLFIEVLEKNEYLREAVQIKHLMIDEFQDTNNIQYDLIKILSEEYGNVFCVADDDQLIYSFRNSDIEILKDFQQNSNELIILDHNYRCSKEILEISNTLISQNQNRINKVLFSNYQSNTKVVYNNYLSQTEEAQKVVEKIQNLLTNEKILPKDIAILYRNNNQSLLIEKELKQQNIPYTLYGGKAFFEYKEIKTIINTYRFLFNPYNLVAFDSIYNEPIPSIEGPVVAEFKRQYDPNNNDIINSLLANNDLTLNELGNKFKYLKEKLLELSNDEFFNELLITLKFKKYIKESNNQKPQYARILALKEIISELNIKDIENSFNDLILENKDLKTHELISLLTIHKSKGLEFKAVFVIGLNEGVLPSYFADFNSLEEERRLCYVALTRAKTHLYISSTNINYINGTIQNYKPSRFINEANIELKEKTNFFKGYWYNK